MIVESVLALLAWLAPRKVFSYGKGCVTRYTLFECKWLFSVYVHHIATSSQDRFHTHAFRAVAFILSGGYSEVQKLGLQSDAERVHRMFNAPTMRYIPRLLNHKLLQAQPNTVSLLLTGPYNDMWTEETDDGHLRLLTSGQKELFRSHTSAPEMSSSSTLPDRLHIRLVGRPSKVLKELTSQATTAGTLMQELSAVWVEIDYDTSIRYFASEQADATPFLTMKSNECHFHLTVALLQAWSDNY